MSLILETVKKALVDGEATVNLKEASALTGSGSGVGGRVIYDDAFAALRYGNPLRLAGSRVIDTIGSDEAFVVKTGNSTLIQSGSDNPWGYPVNSNVGNEAIKFWQLPVRAINATVPVRSAVLSDVNYLEESLVGDIMLEFAQQEALSMMLNNDQSGSTTVNYGATSGLRGLNSYTNSTSAAAFGSNGSAITNGIHTVLGVAQAANTAVTYDDLANLQAALPAQYLYKPTTAFMMHPTTIGALRKLKASGTANNFLEVGDDDGQPFRFVQYTKTSYGNDKAKLTLLLDGMVGRMTQDAYNNLDLPALKAKPWQVVVGTRQKMNGELTNVVETVKPVKVAPPKPLRKAVPVTDDIADPFGED